MSDKNHERTKPEIVSLLNCAKLKEDDLLPTTQLLYLNETNAKKDHYKLLELDNHLLEELKTGNAIQFKGDENETVVLCTESRTYEVRECETSNSLLLTPDLQFSEELKKTEDEIKRLNVKGINYKYLELTPTKPKFYKALKLLEKTVYKGPELEFEYNETDLLTFESLLTLIQVSRSELDSYIKNRTDVIILNDKIRLLELSYHFRVLSYLMKSVEEHSWPLDEIEKEESIKAWSEIAPEEILTAVFNIYAEESKRNENETKTLYKYNELKICQFFAKVLLNYASKFNYNDFVQAWRESVPEGMTVQEEMLNGLAIIDRTSKPNVVWLFLEENLPNTIPERFQALFSAKPKWTVPEITPYISSLTSAKMDASALLAKYARASTVNGVRHYSSKYDK